MTNSELEPKYELALEKRFKPVEDQLNSMQSAMQHQSEMMQEQTKHSAQTLALLEETVLGENGSGGLRSDVRELRGDINYFKSGKYCPHTGFITEIRKSRKTVRAIGGVILLILVKDAFVFIKALVPAVLKIVSETN